MRNLVIRLVLNAVALWVAAVMVPGIHLGSDGVVDVETLVVVALIFGVINTLIRPIVALATCPFYLVTLGLFTFVVNAAMLWLTGWLSGQLFGGGLTVDGFWDAFVGGIVISLVSFVLNLVLGDEDKKR